LRQVFQSSQFNFKWFKFFYFSELIKLKTINFNIYNKVECIL
jgi:hypothetical protein